MSSYAQLSPILHRPFPESLLRTAFQYALLQEANRRYHSVLSSYYQDNNRSVPVVLNRNLGEAQKILAYIIIKILSSRSLDFKQKEKDWVDHLQNGGGRVCPTLTKHA